MTAARFPACVLYCPAFLPLTMRCLCYCRWRIPSTKAVVVSGKKKTQLNFFSKKKNKRIFRFSRKWKFMWQFFLIVKQLSLPVVVICFFCFLSVFISCLHENEKKFPFFPGGGGGERSEGRKIGELCRTSSSKQNYFTVKSVCVWCWVKRFWEERVRRGRGALWRRFVKVVCLAFNFVRF